jgi:hypothetical protein
LILFTDNYNNQAIHKPDEFNAIDFDPAKFIKQQTQSMTHPSIHEEKILDENKSKYFETQGILNLSLRDNKHENLLNRTIQFKFFFSHFCLLFFCRQKKNNTLIEIFTLIK